jgi:hypothetical protein
MLRKHQETAGKRQGKGCHFDYDSTCALAARHGHLDVLKWLVRDHAEYCRGPRSEVLTAIEFFWIGRQFLPDERTTASAAAGGHLHILIWLKETLTWRLKIDEATCMMAARNGDLDVLQWAVSNGAVAGQSTLIQVSIILYTYYIHIIYIFYTYYIHIIYIFYAYFIHILYILYTYYVTGGCQRTHPCTDVAFR